jgi:hypothetical protein
MSLGYHLLGAWGMDIKIRDGVVPVAFSYEQAATIAAKIFVGFCNDPLWFADFAGKLLAEQKALLATDEERTQ